MSLKQLETFEPGIKLNKNICTVSLKMCTQLNFSNLFREISFGKTYLCIQLYGMQ